MAYLNENYLKLQAGYLFPEIARRVREFCEANPDAAAKLIRCGIGDVTEPLPAAALAGMRRAIDETNRRRTIQERYNIENDITPQTIIKPIDMSLVAIAEGDYVTVPLEPEDPVEEMTPEQRDRFILDLEESMREAARKFDFKKAAEIRDRVKALKSPGKYEEAAASSAPVRG